MSCSESSGSSAHVPLIRRRRSDVSKVVQGEADVGPSTMVRWSDEGSPNIISERDNEVDPLADVGGENVLALMDVDRPERILPISTIPELIDEVGSPAEAGDENVEVASTTGRQSRGRRQRAPRRKPVVNRGIEYLQCDNDSDIYPSWCTEESIGVMRSHCRMPAQIEIRIPGIEERPWHCPKGFVCLYESFFLEGCLWFPLPDLLVTYCRERGLAISQLTAKSICHIVGMLVLGSEAGIDISNRFLEEICSIKKTKGRIFYVSTKPKFNLITHDKGDNLRGWQRFYFFAKLDDLTIRSTQKIFTRWANSYGS